MRADFVFDFVEFGGQETFPDAISKVYELVGISDSRNLNEGLRK